MLLLASVDGVRDAPIDRIGESHGLINGAWCFVTVKSRAERSNINMVIPPWARSEIFRLVLNLSGDLLRRTRHGTLRLTSFPFQHGCIT
ncbi:hypothetical protein HZ326_5965 [Fusarium oxysporum f. sp. albedinis]|nr:hypothetical protein HZ326_5965 [Fusarium oxysporum f. sp. albedinis]